MSRPLKTTRLSVGTVFLVVFVLVSSGPFGVEEMVSATGPGLALILLLVIPVVWGAPLALLCTELASAIPDEGGAYVWIERAFGRFWAFQSGWWGTLSGLLDTTIYAVLAASYANSWLGLGAPGRWLMSAAVIVFFATINLRSLRSMALSSVTFALIILTPCAVMTVLGIAAWRQNPFVPLLAETGGMGTSLGLGLAIVIWFYSGYESMSTMAGEVAEPERVIPKALVLSIPAVVLVYVLPTAAGLASIGRWPEWDPDTGITLVQVSAELGGPLLGGTMMVAALASSLALYNAYLAAGARTTYVMAERRLLPRVFARVHPRFGTPAGSIVITAGIHALLAIGSFEALIVIDVLLFVMTYVLIFVASVALRVREPGLPRPFRIPVGTGGMIVLAAAPTGVALLLLAATDTRTLLLGSAAAATGPVAYLLLRRFEVSGSGGA